MPDHQRLLVPRRQGATYGTLLIKLKNWDDRTKEESVTNIIRQLYGMTAHVKDGRVVFFAPPMITGYSVTNGFELKLQDKTGGDINQFFAVTQAFLAQLNAQPEIAQAYTTFNPTFPQYLVDIDAAKAKKAVSAPLPSSLPCRVTTAVCMCQTSTASVRSTV